ncbi:MAG TPA: hypothetical protein VL793_07530, partial [Patescibacteria group bacterium]|nr:hypothetical protein [Patescibacteria group bacterium]
MSAQPGGQLQKLWRTRKGFAAGLLLFLLVLAGFMPALSNDFVGYDDPEYVTANPHVQQGLTWETLRWAFSNTEVAAWHPLVWLSHALDYECFGLRPWGHHLTAILLHGVNAVLCFVVLRRLTGAFARSWAAAALFALHPLRVESVAWVSERKDVLSMVFFLLMLWSYTRYVQTRNSKERLEIRQTKKPAAGSSKAPAPIRHGLPWFFFGFSLFSFALGLMSKPMLVTGPAVLLLLDLWPLGRFQREPVRKLLVEKLPFFLAALLVSMVTMLAQPRGTVTLESASLIARSENAVVSYCRYLGKIFWPVDLAPFYPPVVHWPATAWVSAGIVLAAISFLAVRLWRSRPYLLVGWLWFLVALLPVIGLVQIGEQSVTDRYTYLPGIGILLMLVWVISESNWQYRTVGVGALLGCVLMG